MYQELFLNVCLGRLKVSSTMHDHAFCIAKLCAFLNDMIKFWYNYGVDEKSEF